MFTRKKLQKILERHQQEITKNYFKKFKLPKDTYDDVNNSKFNNKINDVKHWNNTEIDSINPKHTKEKTFKDTGGVTLIKAHFLSLKSNAANWIDTEIDLDKNLKDLDHLDIFHRAIRPIILIGQCFAAMPLVGVFNKDPRNMRFSYKSLPMLFTGVYLISNSLILISMIKHVAKLGIDAKNVVGVVFFSCAQSACLLFLFLARRWPSLIENWTRIEIIFTKAPYEQPKRNMKTRVRLAAFIIIGCSIMEHAFSNISGFSSYRLKKVLCAQARNETALVSFDDYMQVNYVYVFNFLPYTMFLGIFLLIVNGISTFIWNYMDLFIMMVSKGIAYRFEQIMMRINKIADQDISEHIFIEIRVHYVKVCELLDMVDEHISSIILLSCMNNLYFVCYQLLNIFNKLRWPINYIYFWFSLLYLIGRTAFVFLTAASINDESKAALSALRSVSHKTWCVEVRHAFHNTTMMRPENNKYRQQVERLIFQMTTQTVALSGKKFYFLTRRLLFGMAGTIVTYELVLLQFDEPNRSQGLPPLCN